MEVTHSFMADLRGRLRCGEIVGESSGFDWAGLHARLCAGHAARRALAGTDSPREPRSGDFAQLTKAVRPAANPSPRVNLNNSTDSKAVGRNAVTVAEHSKAGD